MKEMTENASRWYYLALAHGYNELARKAETLGEKVYCRLGRDQAEEAYKQLGGQIERTGESEPVR